MNAYMLLVSENENATPAEHARVMEGRAAYVAQLRDSGALLDAERLRTSREGRRVTSTEVKKGPFGDALNSYLTVKAKDLDSAVTLAKQLPTLAGDSVEVRPVMKGKHDANKTDKPGKVFAFGVLGNAPNEEAWIRVMDRIDSESNDAPSAISPEAFLCGLRLDAPRTGRRLVNQHGKTVVLDGPFLESKEVIGGLFFMRMPSLEDAVEWATKTSFVKLGACEIREVQRS